jgi:hypothetical protein
MLPTGIEGTIVVANTESPGPSSALGEIGVSISGTFVVQVMAVMT